MDQLAAELGMDPLELRRKNFIPAEDFPAELPHGIVYDSGNYHGHARQAARARRPRRRSGASRPSCASSGIYRGIGFSTYVEICGLAPSRVARPGRLGHAGRLLRVGASCACTRPAR